KKDGCDELGFSAASFYCQENVKGRQTDTQAEIYNIDLDHTSKVLSMQEDSEVQEVVEVVNAAKLITEVVTTATTQVILDAKPVVAAVTIPISAAKPKGLKAVVAASTPIPAAKSAVVAVSTPISVAKLAAKPKVLKIVAAAPAVLTRKRKGVVIRDPKEELHDDTPAETLSVKDKGKGILVEDPKPIKKKDQIEMDAEYAGKLQEELDKENEESFKKINLNTAFDHVQAKDVQAKGTQYIKRYHGFKKKPQYESEARKNMIAYLKNTEEMEKEEEEIIKSINETPAQKATKRRRLCEQAKEDKDLQKQLEVVVDEDNDVFIKATPIATLKTMFEKTDAQDVIWRSQQTEYGQALVKSWKLLTLCSVYIITFTTTMFVLLVEKRYPLSRFTLEQLVNVSNVNTARLELKLFRDDAAAAHME
nr:hypothetical protein [Tanacetum cinerariifolium]